jgi:hypothetical protein
LRILLLLLLLLLGLMVLVGRKRIGVSMIGLV